METVRQNEWYLYQGTLHGTYPTEHFTNVPMPRTTLWLPSPYPGFGLSFKTGVNALFIRLYTITVKDKDKKRSRQPAPGVQSVSP